MTSEHFIDFPRSLAAANANLDGPQPHTAGFLQIHCELLIARRKAAMMAGCGRRIAGTD
jgi:hypothetical protein